MACSHGTEWTKTERTWCSHSRLDSATPPLPHLVAYFYLEVIYGCMQLHTLALSLRCCSPLSSCYLNSYQYPTPFKSHSQAKRILSSFLPTSACRGAYWEGHGCPPQTNISWLCIWLSWIGCGPSLRGSHLNCGELTTRKAGELWTMSKDLSNE